MEDLAISFVDVRAAAERLRGVAHVTPLQTSRMLDALVGRQVVLKCENFQRGGAFKFRGAYNAICQLDAQQRTRGVVTFSSGNHAQGVALAAQLLGVPATVCMPDDAPAVKVAAARGYGAEVLIYERATVDREAFGRAVAAEREAALIPPYDNAHVMAGQGTAALELVEAVGDLDALLAPIGGGGLISGSAIAACGLNPRLKIFGVETVGADDARQSLARGERVAIPPPTTIADGIRTQTPGALTFPVIQRYVEDVLVVDDATVLEALRFMLLRMKLVAEPTGAVALAALVAGLLPQRYRRVGVMVSGGNLDPALLAKIVGA